MTFTTTQKAGGVGIALTARAMAASSSSGSNMFLGVGSYERFLFGYTIASPPDIALKQVLMFLKKEISATELCSAEEHLKGRCSWC